jgi:hypothetical protein
LIPQTSALADPCSGCAIQQPGIDPIITPEEPADGCSQCALPTPAPQRLADGCTSCAVEQPDTPVLPQIPQDGGCSGCATPPLPSQRAAFRPIIVADGTGGCSGC